MARAAVIGSGPAGVATASTLLEQGWHVDVFDGGVEPDAAVEALRQELAPQLQPGGVSQEVERKLRWADSPPPLSDVVRRVWLQVRGQVDAGVIRKRWLGSDFVFSGIERWSPVDGDFLPQSLAIGGLSRVWGAACYPLRTEDHDVWPIDVDALGAGYRRAQHLLGLDQADDELRRIYPIYGPTSDGSDWSPNGHLAGLLRHWRRHAETLQRHGIGFGRSRLAVDRHERGEQGCIRCGQCLYGCARRAIWSADMPLADLRASSHYRHFPGAVVWRVHERRQTCWLEFAPGCGPAGHTDGYDAAFLAAGPLSSFRVAAESLGRSAAGCDLLDSDVIVIPFIPRGSPGDGATGRFGLSEAVLAFDAGVIGSQPAHMQLYQFSGPMAGSLADLLLRLPASMTELGYRFLNRIAIGVLYLNSDDSRRLEVTLGPPRQDLATLSVRGRPGAAVERLPQVLGLMRELAPATGMRVIESQVTPLPAGFSCHLAGTLPMRDKPQPLQTDPQGLVAGFERLYAVDASVFPRLPAQNSTFTIMANAIRVAEAIGATAP